MCILQFEGGKTTRQSFPELYSLYLPPYDWSSAKKIQKSEKKDIEGTC
jgi:hypothetical protein